MKQLKDPKKIFFYIVIALIIVAGIVMVAVKGFNVELRYKANQKIELVIGETIEVEKIQQKADEVFGKGKSVVQLVEVFKDSVQITAEEISEEQKNALVEKVNELYPQEVTEEGKEPEKLIDASKITINSTENARLRDFLKPYVIPGTIVTLVILVYYAILYRKLGVLKVFSKSILTIVLAQLVLLSTLAIIRFPMGRLTTPLILLVYVTSLIYTSGSLIKDQKAKVQEK
jgi:preprotein translocase subunit SecF